MHYLIIIIVAVGIAVVWSNAIDKTKDEDKDDYMWP